MTTLSEAEIIRRKRICKGWAFRPYTEEKILEIKLYLQGGPVPEEFLEAHELEPVPVKKDGKWV